MDRRAFGLLFIFERDVRACSHFTPGTTLERSPSIPPRGDWFRFGHVQCAAVQLERWRIKKRPHGARCQWQHVHAGEEVVSFAIRCRL
jgi:hypothetical protein